MRDDGRQKHDARRRLLAQVHIAIKDLGIMDEDYRDILRNEFNVESARVLSVSELRRLVGRFRRHGWQPRRKGRGQAKALRHKIRKIFAGTENAQARMDGLARKVAGVDKLAWCRDVDALKRMAAIAGGVSETESVTRLRP